MVCCSLLWGGRAATVRRLGLISRLSSESSNCLRRWLHLASPQKGLRAPGRPSDLPRLPSCDRFFSVTVASCWGKVHGTKQHFDPGTFQKAIDGCCKGLGGFVGKAARGINKSRLSGKYTEANRANAENRKGPNPSGSSIGSRNPPCSLGIQTRRGTWNLD